MSDPTQPPGDGKPPGDPVAPEQAAAGKARRRNRTVTGLGQAVRDIKDAGQSVTRAITESAMHHVHTSGAVHRMPTVLPREERRKRLLIRSVAIGFFLIFTWIGVMVGLQLLGERKGPDFRVHATAFFTALTSEDPSQIYGQASPRLQETILEDKFINNAREVVKSLGKFREIASVINSEATRGPGGRAGHIAARLVFDRETTNGTASFHFIDGQWRLLGYSIDVPASMQDEVGSDEASVARAKAPPEIRPLVESILETDRAGNAGEIWDQASSGFKASVERKVFEDLSTRRREILGPYKRIINVTDATLSPSQGSVSFVAAIEFGNAMTTGSFSFAKENEQWKLTFYKLIIPQPRVAIPDEDEDE